MLVTWALRHQEEFTWNVLALFHCGSYNSVKYFWENLKLLSFNENKKPGWWLKPLPEVQIQPVENYFSWWVLKLEHRRGSPWALIPGRARHLVSRRVASSNPEWRGPEARMLSWPLIKLMIILCACVEGTFRRDVCAFYGPGMNYCLVRIRVKGGLWKNQILIISEARRMAHQWDNPCT